MKGTDKKASFQASFLPVCLTMATLALSSVYASPGQVTGLEPCLDYFKVGVSGCTPQKPTPTVVVTPTVAAPGAQSATPTAPAVPTLDTKIDDFLANHGKPPREFVAFYLEPTAENAMKWISKYNELVDRNIQLSIAWMQAETLYKRELASGTLPSQLVSSTLPAVPNFGIAVPGFTDSPALANTTYPGFGGSLFIAPPSPIPGINPQTGAMASMPLASIQALNPNGSLSSQPTPVVPATMPVTVTPTNAFSMSEDLTYYYSGVCPYCKKFTPELAQSLTLFKNLKMSCVDLTPTGPDESTKPANIPCTWRVPTDDELTVQNIRQTPTLLIKGPGGYPLRISGYVDSARLHSYFNAAGLASQP